MQKKQQKCASLLIEWVMQDDTTTYYKIRKQKHISIKHYPSLMIFRFYILKKLIRHAAL